MEQEHYGIISYYTKKRLRIFHLSLFLIYPVLPYGVLLFCLIRGFMDRNIIVHHADADRAADHIADRDRH